jgi:D-glycero-alpha-D-manno-heptose 1-phosphate guanylyltransferase
MINEAIVLAGGLGTRLQTVVGDLPKSLAPVAGKPFLAYLLDYSKKQGIEKFIFALGHKSEQIESFVKKYLPEGSYTFSVEEKPLGTGGAIYKACKLASTPNTIVINADTFFGITFQNLSIIHELRNAACTMTLKPMTSFERFGAVDIHKQVITGFSEKKPNASGLINGAYMRLPRLFCEVLSGRFFLRKIILEKNLRAENHGMISDAYFIDIGIPEDASGEKSCLRGEW